MKKKELYKLYISLATILGLIFVGILYIINIDSVVEGYIETEGMLWVVIIILIRICTLSIGSWYIFHQWFGQEEVYLSDLPFLFGILFFILIFGKLLDLLFFLTFFTLGLEGTILLMKIRFIVLILTLIPMIYLSIGMILYYFSLKNKYESLKEEKFRDKLRTKILMCIILIQILAVFLATTVSTILILLPLFVLPSICTIVWLFYFSYKNNALRKVNSKLLMIGFGSLLATQLIRPIMQIIIGNQTMYVLTTELIDFVAFLVIFIGFYMDAS
jgi:hypothetical protein